MVFANRYLNFFCAKRSHRNEIWVACFWVIKRIQNRLAEECSVFFRQLPFVSAQPLRPIKPVYWGLDSTGALDWFNLCFNNLFVPGYIFVLVVHQFTTFCCLCLNQPVAPSHTVQQHLKTSLGGNHEGDKTSVSGILCDICDEDKRVSFVKVPFSHQNLKMSLTCQLQWA